MEYIENKTFDEINVGDTASIVRTLSEQDIDLFAVMSGDVNPAHVDPEFARSDMFREVIAHGMWGGSLISTVLGTKMPGPGAIYLEQTLQFRRPVKVGDTITISVTATEKDGEKHRITFNCRCVNQEGKEVINGVAKVIAPTEKIKRPRVVLPEVHLHRPGFWYKQLVEKTSDLEPIRTAVVHPVDRYALMGAIDAAEAGIILPILVGPEARIRAVAETESIDLSPYEIIPTPHSHAAAIQAVALARQGKVEMLMKGSLPTSELMEAAVVRDSGLRTGRRMSHVSAMDVPSYERPLFITDAALNITPTLDDKVDIVQNAIDLVRGIGVDSPRVALLSALETVSPKIPSSIEAAALTKMADRGQITGGILDGPLAFDLAVSERAARIKGVVSPVAGKADILVVPDVEAGTMLVKQLTYLAEAQVAGVVVGARVPIALTSRSDTPIARMASCAIAQLLAHTRRQGQL